MSNFHNYPSKEWKHQEWKTSNRILLNTHSTASTAASLQSTSLSIASAAARATGAADSCLHNCKDAFRDSILPYDMDFDKICAILADENDDDIFDTLYICDEGCVVGVNGTGPVGQDREFSCKYLRAGETDYPLSS